MITISVIWTGILLGEGYSCIMEEMRDPDENRKKRCSQWKHWSVSLNLYITKFGLMTTYEYIAVAMHRND